MTIDMDITDIEVYGRRKRGVEFNHQGQRVGRPHVAAWAETTTVLATDLGSGRDDPRATAAELLGRALAALPEPVRAGPVRLRADAGYFAGQLARAALFADVQVGQVSGDPRARRRRTLHPDKRAPTLQHRLIAVPARLVRHALTLRLPPGEHLLAAVLARIRALPAPS